MTTSVKIHVNGRYKAEVVHNLNVPVVVHGNYEGSPNPSGEQTFWLQHGTENNFRISETEVPKAEKPAAEPSEGGSSKPSGG